MNLSPPSALLRLREADIVRLCGFEAATRGLDLAGRQAVSGATRVGARLEATVTDAAPLTVAAEITDGASHPTLRWNCSGHAEAGAVDTLHADSPGCEHVAALLTAWMRAPGDFLSSAPNTPIKTQAPSPTAPPEPTMSHASRRQTRSRPQTLSPASATLADELARLPARDLLAMARRTLSADLTESEARARLTTALTDPAHVQALLERLDTHPRWLLGALLLVGGAITAADLESLAGRSGRAPSALVADAQALALHGLLFATIAPRAEHRAGERPWRALEGWRIPQEIRAATAHAYTLDILFGDGQTLASSPHSVAGMRIERSSPRSVFLALALLARAPPPLGPFRRQERIERASQTNPERTQGLTVAGDLPAGRLAELARTAGLEPGLARMARRILLWAREQAPGQPVTDLARLPQAERAQALRRAFALWRETDTVAELVDLDLTGAAVRARPHAHHAAFSPAAVATEVGEARRFILSLLARARPSVWYALDDLLTLVWRVHPGFLRGRQRAFATPAWLLERADGARRPLRMNVHDEWREAEGVWIRALLTGPLRWWGAVDLAYDMSARVAVAFRLTPLGASLLHGDAHLVDTTLPDDWGPAILLTRERELATQPLSAGADLLDALAQWARPVSVVGGRLLYALAPDLACAAFDHGLDYAALGERLCAVDPRAGPRVAEQVVARLSAWRVRYGRTRIRERVALLEARDEPTLAEALAYAPAIAARARRIGPAAALLAPGDLAELRTLLARKGYEL
jgi:hypothetical protein